jgi:alcohol dehydrogenase
MNIKTFAFKMRTNLRFGVGESEKLADVIKALGYKNIGVIIDSGVFENKFIEKLVQKIKDADLKISIFENKVSEPDYDYLEEYKKQFLNIALDCLVGIGGGSTLDLTKGVATLIKNPGKAIEYKGFPILKYAPLPVIAIPTTAGTGSEVTYNAVFTDSKEKKKLGINSELNFPLCAIIDPLLTLDCPKSVTISSGMDALTHSLESFAAKNATLVSRIFSKEAFKLVFNSLIKVTDDMGNIGIRSNLLLGSYLAGIALSNSGAGPAGAMSYPMGSVYKIPHGLAGGLFLAKVIRFNVDNGYNEYAQLYDLIDGAKPGLNEKEKSFDFCKMLDKLTDKLEIPKKLNCFNIHKNDVEYLLSAVFGGLKGAIEQNPVKMAEDDMRNILNSMV